MFVLDYVPQEYLRGGPKDSVVVFTAGWAMKFVPLLGKALADMALHGKSEFALKEFFMTRKDEESGQGILIVDGAEGDGPAESASIFASTQQASGSSIGGFHKKGL